MDMVEILKKIGPIFRNFSVNFLPEKIAKNVVRTPYLKGLCHGSLVHFV